MSFKANVLFIVQNASFPFDKRVSKEALSLKNNNYKVFVICPTSIYDPELRNNINSINVYRYKNYLSDGSFIGFFFEYLLSLIKIFSISLYLIIKEEIKVIHVANPPDFFWPLAILTRLIGVKFIYDQHDLAPEMFQIRFKNNLVHKILNLNEKLTVLFSNYIITVNQTFKERLIIKYNIPPEKCVVVYNGPYENFEPVKSDELINKYKDKKIILYVGLMTITDNIEIIIEAAKMILREEERTDCHFILIGEGDVRASMEQLSSQYRIINNITFTGMLKYQDVMKYLYIANVCIAPDQLNGLNENLTLIKVLEYMKAKKSFVAFNLDETKRMAQDSGLYADDLEDYKNKILYLIDNPEEANKMGQKGNEIITNNYLWGHSEKRILKLYEKLFNN